MSTSMWCKLTFLRRGRWSRRKAKKHFKTFYFFLLGVTAMTVSPDVALRQDYLSLPLI